MGNRYKELHLLKMLLPGSRKRVSSSMGMKLKYAQKEQTASLLHFHEQWADSQAHSVHRPSILSCRPNIGPEHCTVHNYCIRFRTRRLLILTVRTAVEGDINLSSPSVLNSTANFPQTSLPLKKLHKFQLVSFMENSSWQLEILIPN